MDLETSRNCPVLINPINPMICFSTDPGIYKVLCCYCRMVYLHYMFSRGRTGDGLGDLEKLSSDDESGEKSLDQFRDLLGLLLLLLDSLSLLYLLHW